MSSQIRVESIVAPEGSDINFGATVSNVNVENITGKSVPQC
jgi:hypothetical protein